MENKKIRTFEDLKFYQMERGFSQKVGTLIMKLPPEEKINLINQMRRADALRNKYLTCEINPIVA